MRFIAHTKPGTDETQLLRDHLTAVAELASGFAAPFGAQQVAYRCGLLHDAGKYTDAFQRRINGSNERVDHSTAGAKIAAEQGDAFSALCIAGHHGGIPNIGNRADTEGDSTLQGRLKRTLEDCSAYLSEISVPEAELPTEFSDNAERYFFTRMLYSCLVDADWLDTEAFVDGSSKRKSVGKPVDDLFNMLVRHVGPWQNPSTELNKRRCSILNALLERGFDKRGLFSLTVPTGGGKTVSSMAFALRHMVENNMRRVIYVIPYTSIIEQTQVVFEQIFGAENIVAHYANATFDDQDPRRFATENWDAPIILTTAVQFFESIFAHKPSKSRKLHNIADSVVIFDEAQMLPVQYLKPCLWSITQLVRRYSCSAVLCTATQPSLDKLLTEYLPNSHVSELCPDVSGMYDFFRRVRYERLGKLDDQTIANELNGHKQVLCIVNTKAKAKALFDLADKDGRFHLSTAMTASHRQEVLKTIRERLERDEVCRVVSTSLIEAGVDVDFPVVFRELAGLDSIIQAGGRCNRENRRERDESIVYIFETDKVPLYIKQNVSAANLVMRDFADIASPEAIKAYFDNLYYLLKGEAALDQKKVLEDINALRFIDVSAKVKIIDDNARTVYIPIDDGAELVSRLREHGPTRDLLRKLGRYSVGVYSFDNLIHAIEILSEDTAILNDTSLYDKETGLALDVTGGLGLFV